MEKKLQSIKLRQRRRASKKHSPQNSLCHRWAENKMRVIMKLEGEDVPGLMIKEVLVLSRYKFAVPALK